MSKNVVPRGARNLLRWVAGLLVAVLAVGGLSTPAFAADGKVTVFPVESGRTHNGAPVLSGDGTYAFQIGYGSMSSGAVVPVTLPEGITIPQSALVVPAGNTAVESLAVNAAGQLVITFRDPFPTDVQQGILDLTLVVETVQTSQVRDLTWNVDGQTTTQQVIVTKPGDAPQPTQNASNKAAGWVSIPHRVVDGKVVLDEAALKTEIPYTVTVSSRAAREVTLTDTLGAHLSFVPGSLAGNKTVRDDADLNPVSLAVGGLPAIGGTTFTHTFAAEANSVYTFTYKAEITDAAALAAIQAELQRQYDAVDKVNGGSYSVALTNGVVVNGEERGTTTTIRGDVGGQPRPGTGAAFRKSAEPTAVALDEQLAAGAPLGEGIPVTYTLGADLTVFADFADGPFALSRNVVLRDTLADQISWNTSDPEFLHLTDQDGTEITLSPAPGLSGNAEAAIAADDYVHTYVVSGTSLYVNLGKDVATRYTLTAKATIDSLPKHASHDSQYETQYRADNNAYFVYADGRYEPKGASTTITVPKDLTGGVDDPTRFAKTTSSATVTLTPGTSANIPYTFTVGQNVGDAAASRIVDVVDHSVFDVTEETLPAIKASIAGTYDWNYPLDGSMFDVALDADDNLVLAPNAAFPGAAPWGGTAAAPYTGRWTVTLSLPTQVLQGKQTIEVKNAARYEGTGSEIVYTSTSTAKATSYGNEMEVRKRVYDAAHDSFTGNLRVGMDAQGALLNDEFVYRIELMPHGTFTNMVEDVVDVLPAGVEFVGFVEPADLTNGRTVAGPSYTIPGSNIVAEYDAATDTVTLERGRLSSGQTVALFFKVRITSHQPDAGITNVIGAAGATITPTNDYPLSLLKRDSTNAAKMITDPSARFSVLAEDARTVVLTGLRVVDGRILTSDGTSPVVSQPGGYWLREDVAPSGYERETELTRIVVEPDGSSADVVLYNTPGSSDEPDRTYAIGDVVWIDADEDGRQDDLEQVLPGVKVDLIRNGEVVATTTTDARGRYLFDELAAGEYQVRFTLTEQQCTIYAFTTQKSGTDGAIDSDADPETGMTQTIVLGEDNPHLTHDYPWADVRATQGVDPTWDAGVVVRDVIPVPEPVVTPPAPGAPAVEPLLTPPAPGSPGVDASHPGTPGVNELAVTGGSFSPWMAALGALLLAAGTIAVVLRMRRSV